MGKSFNNNLERPIQVRDGQAVWTNLMKKVSSQLTALPVGNNIEVRVFPYAKQVVGLDFFQNLDADPMHTSLPTGEYYGVQYTHSDNCLVARYPDIAASLRPTVEFYVRQQYAVIDQVAVTLIIDAIGALMVCGTEIYGTALTEARAISGYKTRDEDDFAIGAFLLDGCPGWAQGLDFGHRINLLAAGSNVFMLDTQFNQDQQRAQVDAIGNNHNVTQSRFDREINYSLTYAFLTPTMKSLCEIFYGMVIKYRYADADTSRYLVAYPDNYIAAGNQVRYEDATAYLTRLVNNHVRIILNRYSFMADLMRSLGFTRLDGSKPSDSDVKTNRLILNTSNNSLGVTYDKDDAIKNMVDHNGITYDEINAVLAETNNTAHDTYVHTIYLEADSYLNNELEYRDSLLVNDSILTVLLHDGIRLYNACFVNYYKGAGNVASEITYTVSYPKILEIDNTQNMDDDVVADIVAVNSLMTNTSLMDPTWVSQYDTNDTGHLIIRHEHINAGINTYAAPHEDVQMIESYAVIFIGMDHKKIADNNSKLGNNPNLNTNAR